LINNLIATSNKQKVERERDEVEADDKIVAASGDPHWYDDDGGGGGGGGSMAYTIIV